MGDTHFANRQPRLAGPAEQLGVEEEALARLTLDKLKLIGSDQAGLYLFVYYAHTFALVNPNKILQLMVALTTGII